MLSINAIRCDLLRRTLRRGGISKIQMAGVVNKIGNREWVGFGVNGEPVYVDRWDFPFPAVRFRETTNELLALKEKEKGDWRKLTCEEKKCLYRASFCQTFSELLAPTGEWKSVIGIGLFLTSLGIWSMLAMKLWLSIPLPESFSEERRRAQFRRSLDLRISPIFGPASKWDYEKDDWK